MAPKVLAVGHCRADSSRLAREVEKAGGTFEGVATADEAMTRLRAESYALVLTNRVIGLDERGGEALIRRVKEDPGLREVPLMLVSAIDTAQEAARRAGAEPGFGKDQLDTPKAAERISAFLRPVTDA